MPTTIRDVAAVAGVSPATVSRVLNMKEDVADDLRRRVLAAVAELGYRRNGPARSLRTRATMVIGLIISDITNPFFTAVVRGAEDVAQLAGYSVVLANADEDVAKESRYLEVAAAEQMAGVLLTPASSRLTSIDILLERNIPVVTIDRRLARRPVDSVTVNNRQADAGGGAHLIGQGCRRVGFVAGPVAISTGASRLAGYRAALRAAGRTDDPSLVAYADFRTEGGYTATRQLLHSAHPPDGLLISNNLMTVGGMQAIAEAGLRHPGRHRGGGLRRRQLGHGAAPAPYCRDPADLRDRADGGRAPAPPHRRREIPAASVVLRAELIERASSQRTGPD